MKIQHSDDMILFDFISCVWLERNISQFQIHMNIYNRFVLAINIGGQYDVREIAPYWHPRWK